MLKGDGTRGDVLIASKIPLLELYFYHEGKYCTYSHKVAS